MCKFFHFDCGERPILHVEQILNYNQAKLKDINDFSPSETRTTNPLHYRPTLNHVSYSAPQSYLDTRNDETLKDIEPPLNCFYVV